MKKIYLAAFVVISAFAISSCSKEEDPQTGGSGGGDVYSTITVPATNTALVVKHSGTACPPCGGWGWTAWDDIISTNASGAHFLTAYDDNFVAKLFINQVSEDWATALALNSWPTFCANYKVQTARVGNGIDVAKTKQNITDVVNAHNSGTVVANSAFKTSVEGDIMTVNTKTKFFSAGDGEYYLATYVVENGVMGAQAGHPSYPSPVAHKYVLRDSYDETGKLHPSYGVMLTSGAVSAGTEFKNEHKFRLEPTWNKDNVTVFSVIWKKVGTKYEFVNMAK
ncbi:MAG: Omp28-related outer membrane protein [Bacteroidota bacterium]|nr:Omp28-related outer membrane protein [Bacteroidota bacterium]MDX5431916.1 Omp28-related outer membrane protein [Bacteroidota bacterium]MDX5470631.1 Omp28-related outer membrane protein [Bacteroidota bacterium]